MQKPLKPMSKNKKYCTKSRFTHPITIIYMNDLPKATTTALQLNRNKVTILVNYNKLDKLAYLTRKSSNITGSYSFFPPLKKEIATMEFLLVSIGPTR